MAIGGSTSPSDGNTYSMNILSSQLSSLFARHIIFDSYNGSIFVSGFDETNDMSVQFIAATNNGTHQYIRFDDGATSFDDDVSVIAYNGISIDQNMTSVAGIQFEFVNNDIIISQNVHIESQQNIEFVTSAAANTSIIIDSLPVSISASSNISIGVPIILNRSANNTNRFDLFVGNRLSCESPSTGIVLKGASSFGAIINLESSLFVWDTTTCRIDVELPNQSDIIWLHPTRTTTTMYIGGDADIDALYSLSNAELNTINASMLYLGDHDTRYVSQISISNLSLLSIQNLYISSLHASGNIEFLADSETVFNAMNVNLMANNGITFDDASSLLLNADSSHNLFLEASKYCEADSSLILRRNTFIKSVGGSVIEYYGGDLIFTDSTAYMNASLSTIKLSEQCSSQYSMAIGGDSILDEYSFNLLTSNLSSLHSRNIIFESANGSMFIAGFNQSSSMNGIAGGSITFDSLNSNIVFDNHSTTFSAANDGAIKIIASNGIQIYTNITSYSASSLLFEFVHSDLIIGRAINIMSSGNIVFSTSNASVAVNSLPTSFYATSNITINVAIGIQRVYAQNYEFAMYAGDVLSCEAPLSLYGSSLYGSTINFESRRIAWNTSRCSIDADADIIWLHPISDIMYLGVDNSMYYSLTNDAINTIATSNRGTLYLGDRNRGTIFVDALDVESSVALNLYILSLNAITNDTMLSVNANAQNIFDSMNVNMFSSGHIALLASSSILLNGATSELFLQTNYGCNSNTMNSTLSICSNCSLSTLNGSRIKYYGGDISIDGSIDGSVILLSERCSTNYSMLIGGSTNYNKYAMALSKSELSNLYCKSISFDSYSGSISIAGLEQATDMNGISNGSITISAQYLSFDESSTSFSLNQDVSIIGNRGININQNVSCSTCSILFSFLQNDLVIAPDVQILIAANIDFNSTQSIYIWGLPVTLECQSNLTISTSMIVNNSASIERDSTLHLYSGNMLSCVVGIELYSNANGSTLDFESRDIDLCGITSRHTSDIIVLHSHDNSGMYIGDSCASDSYCVSNAELNMMNTSATLYLNNSVLYISTVNIAASVASSIYFVAAGNITLYSSNLLNNNVTFISGASLSLSSDSSIVNNQEIAYYGCDINLASTSVINASTLLICEKCSSKYSMLIGDYDTNDTNDYNMILSKSELSTLHGANLIFDSRNGSIHVSGDIPCDGSIQIRAATLVEFCGRHMVEFSGNNAAGITISGYAGIYVDQNITNSAGAGTLTFNFVNGDLVFGSASVYISSFNIIFNSEANKSIIINSLPAGISATSDITLDVDLLLNRSYSQHAEFTFYAGGVLLLHGILLHGEQMSDYGSTINIESSNLIWSTINITSATTSDIIWLHPTPNNSMYLGIDNSMYYSLTNAELKNIAPSLATVVLGDCTTFSNIDSININSLQLDSIAKHLDICAKQVNIMNASSINQSINVITTDSIILTDNASITSTAQLFMQTNLACQYNASKLSICDGCAIVAPNYEYYGSDLEIASSSSIINATNSSIMISERCSTRYSMAIGGSTSPSDGNTYSMNILSSQLSSLFARHIIFDSYNGSIFVSGFDETNDMSVQFIAATNNGTHQYIRFDDGATSFDDDVSVIAYNGISIDQNMTSVAGIQFEFVNNDIIISQNVHIESQQNIEFVTSAAANTSIIIDSLPVSISASSNISIGVPIILNRSANNTNRFDLFVGNRLSCESPSTGIVLKGASSFGAIINLESSLFVWDTTTCRIDVELPNQSDIIWLHPTRTTTTMYIGGDADIDALYSLSNAELNTINASMLYLGDHDTRYVSQISISNLSLLSIQNLYISSLHASGNIEFLADSETVFNAMNVNLMANNGITFDDASSLLLNADSSHNLFLEASKYCEADSSLILRRNTFIKSVGGSVIEYYGGDLIFTDSTAYMNASLSTIKLSEQCSSQYSMAIGGDSILDEYSFNLLTSNLSSLHSRNIIFESANGSMFIAGFNQSSSMNGIAGGSITFDSLNSNIVFDNHSTTFSAANDGAIKIIASNGIQIYTNITSYSASSLLFEFVHSDLIIGRAINIMSSGNIVFSTSNASVAVNSLPTSFYATSNITINVAIGIQRVYAQNYEFAMYAGDVLSCEAPLSLYGSSLYGSTINFESRRIAWNTSRCSIDADADIIWLHPISDIMYLGVDNSMYYS
eukprot:356888_1